MAQKKQQKEASRGKMAAAGMRALDKIGDAWKFKPEEKRALLGGVPKSTFYEWLKVESPSLDQDKLARLSHVVGIYKSLQILFPEPHVADGWVNRPNSAPLFGGKTAKEKMLAEGLVGIAEVRRYLDAQRGGWA